VRTAKKHKAPNFRGLMLSGSFCLPRFALFEAHHLSTALGAA
jgi:hypothetical protein